MTNYPGILFWGTVVSNLTCLIDSESVNNPIPSFSDLATKIANTLWRQGHQAKVSVSPSSKSRRSVPSRFAFRRASFHYYPVLSLWVCSVSVLVYHSSQISRINYHASIREYQFHSSCSSRFRSRSRLRVSGNIQWRPSSDELAAQHSQA
jgi:hypothetical protein